MRLIDPTTLRVRAAEILRAPPGSLRNDDVAKTYLAMADTLEFLTKEEA